MTAIAQQSLLAALRHLVREEKLTVRQLVLVLFLANEDTAPDFGDVRRALQISGPALSRAADRLAILGFVRHDRNEADRRRVFISLTPEGREFVKETCGMKNAVLQK